jgi:general secretion pathway protein E
MSSIESCKYSNVILSTQELKFTVQEGYSLPPDQIIELERAVPTDLSPEWDAFSKARWISYHPKFCHKYDAVPNQIQVNMQAGITFATGLRSILRLDPDVILIGEIRDAETANIAVQAALTGHLMLSSVHSSDAAGVCSRLLDLGIEPFLVASAVIGVVAQRMVRRICPDCSHLIEAPLLEQVAYEKEVGEKQTEFLYGTGCKSCAYTGYLGRTGIFEILLISDSIRTLVTNRVSASQVRAQAIKEGMVAMITDGMHKVKAGITTPAEILRSAYSPD